MNLRNLEGRAAAALNRQLRRKGIVVQRIHPSVDAFSEHLARLFQLLAVDCVLDVGASRGQFRDVLRNVVGFQGRIVSFEPLPEDAAELRKRAVQDPLWTIVECALGPVAGSRMFNLMQHRVFSSFLAPSEAETDAFHNENQVVSTFEVNVRTVDEVMETIPELASARRAYLKMDTQGFDLQVLAGAVGSVPKICALQTEASITRLYANSPDLTTTIRTIEELGFHASGTFTNNPSHFPRLVELDFIFARKDLLPPWDS